MLEIMGAFVSDAFVRWPALRVPSCQIRPLAQKHEGLELVNETLTSLHCLPPSQQSPPTRACSTSASSPCAAWSGWPRGRSSTCAASSRPRSWLNRRASVAHRPAWLPMSEHPSSLDGKRSFRRWWWWGGRVSNSIFSQMPDKNNGLSTCVLFFFFFKQPGLIYFAVRNMIRDAPRVCLHCFNVRAAHQGSTRFCLESMCGENVAEETLQIKWRLFEGVLLFYVVILLC